MHYQSIFNFRSAAFLGLVILSSLTMVQAAPANTSKTAKRTVQFKVYTWFDESKSSSHQVALGTLYYPKGKKMLPLKLAASNLSDEYQMTVNSHIVFYRRVKDQEGDVSYQPAGKAKVKPTAKDVFIYLFPEDDKMNMLVLDITRSHFPENHVLFANTTKKHLLVQLNKKNYQVKPKSQKLLAYSLPKKKTIRISVKDQQSAQKKNLAVMTVGGRKGQRVIAFFYQLEGGQPRLLLERGVDDQSIKISQPNKN